MGEKIPFNEAELEVVAEEPNFFGGTTPIFDYPVSAKEGAVRFYRDHDPLWMLTDVECQTFCPSVIPDNIARAFVFEAKPYPEELWGGPDMFGVDWVYVPVAMGSMENPEIPHLFDDVNDWEDKIVWPDLDSWDWEGSAELNREFLASGKANLCMFLNGMGFERLISFMGFENASLALVDEDQEDALHALLERLTDLQIALVDKCVEHFDIDGFCLHDDWGSQKAPFFSEDAAREFFLPGMKRYNDHIHELGKFSDLHSCGHIESRCGVFADAGFDSWSPMAMNDTIALYEKYGDRIAIGIVNDEPFDPATATEEEQRATARRFAERFCQPGKLGFPSIFYNAPGQMTPAYREELYKASRLAYA